MTHDPSQNPNEIEDMRFEFRGEELFVQTFPHICSNENHNGVVFDLGFIETGMGGRVDLTIHETKQIIAGLQKALFWAETNLELRRSF
jgi:hypothetical protein